ncbi:nitroreductase family deazaflavin-dependent oxidoreductase [Gordonia sp. CPCC 206044]|uniref:nitroreductase family deazaflavin-dependent oxidoreductase n=1 Tax=Gordonia sp. CPCC 206044 TaxID=3140793 RepID=UPI003AF3C6F6
MNVLRPVAIKIGSIGWMPRFLPQIVACDNFVQRITGRRFSLLDLGGLPNITLHVVGRRSGIARSTRLLAVPSGVDWLIAGSYFGGPDMPQWVFNVRAANTVEIDVHGRRRTMTWRELDGDERARAWAQMVTVWPNFDLYVARTERQIPVFLLEPADSV